MSFLREANTSNLKLVLFRTLLETVTPAVTKVFSLTSIHSLYYIRALRMMVFCQFAYRTENTYSQAIFHFAHRIFCESCIGRHGRVV
jgi:hypothetical protein